MYIYTLAKSTDRLIAMLIKLTAAFKLTIVFKGWSSSKLSEDS
jgi:hypothetical protein